MNQTLSSLAKRTAHLSSALGVLSLLCSLILSLIPSPAGAAGEIESVSIGGPALQNKACTVPNGFGQTTRLHYKYTTKKEWTFQVEDPMMDVNLEFFYFQDYDPDGCPFDCSTGKCQTEEVGEGISPFGSFEITDGQEGINSGTLRQSGRLSQGTYQASFWVTSTGSINIGLRVHKQPIPPTATPAPPTPTDVVEPPVLTEPPAVVPPESTPTETPTVTAAPPQITVTVVPPTATDEPHKPKKTPTPAVLPPAGPTIPATLPPPDSTQALLQPVIIPATGADLAAPGFSTHGTGKLLMNLAIGLLGLGLIFYGLGKGNFRK